MHNSLTIEEAARDINLTAQDLAVFQADWDKSGPTYPRSHPLFLTEPYLRSVGRRLNFSDELIEETVKGLTFFNHRPGALRLAWHCHCALFELRNVEYRHISRWPVIPDSAGVGAPLFYLYVMLSGVEQTCALHGQRGIDPSVTYEMYQDVEIWARDHVMRKGTWGLNSLNWLWHHATGRLYQLGRLQYTLDDGWLPYHVYRNKRTFQVAVLAADGMKFRADGQCFDADRTTDANAWTATHTQDDTHFLGQFISPEGRAVPGQVRLPRDQWECVLKPGDPTLGFHIPASGPLTHAQTGESLARAVTFFTKHFPDRVFKGFNCSSWLLDNQLDTVLPEQSNIRRFLREMYLVPVPGATDGQTLDRVFPGYDFKHGGLENAPADTSLQKLFIQQMKDGRKFRTGGCYLFVEDLDWGKEVYRNGRAWRPS